MMDEKTNTWKVNGFINNHLNLLYQIILDLNGLTHYYDFTEKRIHKIDDYHNFTMQVSLEKLVIWPNMNIFISCLYKNSSIILYDAVRIN